MMIGSILKRKKIFKDRALIIALAFLFGHIIQFIIYFPPIDIREVFPFYSWSLFSERRPTIQRYRIEILPPSKFQEPYKEEYSKQKFLKKIYRTSHLIQYREGNTGELTRYRNSYLKGYFQNTCEKFNFRIIEDTYSLANINDISDLKLVSSRSLEPVNYNNDEC